MSTNIYEDILANIDVDKGAWCKAAWDVREDGQIAEDGGVEDSGHEGKSVSRCLVSHVDLALGTSYVKPNGKRFVSKDVKKWRRRERILAHLFALTPQEYRQRFADRGEMPEETEITKERMEKHFGVYGSPRISTELEDAVVSFNDREQTTKAKVRNLLKRAAKQHPED